MPLDLSSLVENWLDGGGRGPGTRPWWGKNSGQAWVRTLKVDCGFVNLLLGQKLERMGGVARWGCSRQVTRWKGRLALALGA